MSINEASLVHFIGLLWYTVLLAAEYPIYVKYL